MTSPFAIAWPPLKMKSYLEDQIHKAFTNNLIADYETTK